MWWIIRVIESRRTPRADVPTPIAPPSGFNCGVAPVSATMTSGTVAKRLVDLETPPIIANRDAT